MSLTGRIRQTRLTMPKNRIDEAEFAEIAKRLGVPQSEVRRAVYSFFGVIVRESRNLPFDDSTRIYTKERFDDFVKVRNIPYIGRIGPVYSRYLKWRGNEAKNQSQVKRSDYRNGLSQDEIENIAADVLSGNTPAPVKKKRGIDLYNRIWMMGRVGKRMARQVIKKEETNGIQD